MSATVYFVAASPSPLSAASSVKHCYRNLGKPPPPIGFQVQGVISVSLTPERTFRGGRDDKTAKNTTINRGEGEDAGGGDTRGISRSGGRCRGVFCERWVTVPAATLCTSWRIGTEVLHRQPLARRLVSKTGWVIARRRRCQPCARVSVASVTHLDLSLFLVVFAQKEIKKRSVRGLTTRSVHDPMTRPPATAWRGARTGR